MEIVNGKIRVLNTADLKMALDIKHDEPLPNELLKLLYIEKVDEIGMRIEGVEDESTAQFN